jgi:hypothetical protein
VGTPAVYSLSELCAGAFGWPKTPPVAHPVKGILKDLLVGLVVAADLVEAAPRNTFLNGGHCSSGKRPASSRTGSGISIQLISVP